MYIEAVVLVCHLSLCWASAGRQTSSSHATKNLDKLGNDFFLLTTAIVTLLYFHSKDVSLWPTCVFLSNTLTLVSSVHKIFYWQCKSWGFEVVCLTSHSYANGEVSKHVTEKSIFRGIAELFLLTDNLSRHGLQRYFWNTFVVVPIDQAWSWAFRVFVCARYRLAFDK